MLTPKQAAERIGVSASLIYLWCKQGLVEHFRLGGQGRRGKVMIDPIALDQFLELRRKSIRTPMALRHIKL